MSKTGFTSAAVYPFKLNADRDNISMVLVPIPDTAPVYVFSGKVEKSDGGYAAGARIQLIKGDALYGGNVRTNSGGAYTVYNVEGGTYTVPPTLGGMIPILIFITQ